MTAPKYAAFISYKHSARSRTIAVALEKELRRYARPWYKKPIKIFRDESSMSAGISLPDLIRKGLKDSTYLIYLAEREAASSPWIVDELLIWNRDLKRTDKLIIVHVSDAISFTNTAGKLVLDWVSSTALPSVLQDYLVDIPLYIEMSWAVKQEDLDIHNPKFKNVVNTITACIRGIEPDDLTGEENLVYRRNKRIRNIALTVFVVLFVISAALGMLFYRSSINEQQNRMLAEQQRDISSRMAISGQKVIQALDVEPVDPTESLILLKQAQTIYNDVNVESNLYKIFFRNNLYSRYHPQSLAYKEYILQTAPSVVLSNALTGVTKTLDIPEPYAFRISKDGKWMAHEGKKALQILELVVVERCGWRAGP